MPKPTNVRVSLEDRSYDIRIGAGLTKDTVTFLSECAETTHAIIITDANVEPLYAEPIAEQLADEDLDVNIMTIEPGETSKSPELAFDLWHGMLDGATDRQSVVVAIGGGVVGDLAGFVAATFARGIRFLQIPTTLLAQVDSSVGGKTGVNLPDAKNIVGAFWQPVGVLADVSVLNTLPEREFLAGMAEVVKYGVILDEDFFGYLEDNVDAIHARDAKTLTHIVARSCRLKADVVEADEREESGRRAILNYGHTFGHALEAATGYSELLHGEGVSIGMQCAARLAARLGRVPAEFVERQKRLLTELKLPIDFPDVDESEVLHLMRRDKKVADGQMRFVLPCRLGEVELVSDVPITDVQASFQGS